MRDDIELKPYAEKLGFTAEVSKKGEWKPGVPYDAYSFVKGNVHVWSVRDGWRIARLVDGKFCDHITRDDLTVALNTAETMIEPENKEEPMGIPVIERTEARTENDIAIVCEHQDRAPDRKPFVIARQNLEVPVDLRILELEDLNELIDLRNILNEMIDSVQPEG